MSLAAGSRDAHAPVLSFNLATVWLGFGDKKRTLDELKRASPPILR